MRLIRCCAVGLLACGSSSALTPANHPDLHLGLIEGRVTDSKTGQPIVGAIVSLGRDNVEVESVRSDSNGHYRLEGSPGISDLSARYHDEWTGPVKVVVRDGVSGRADLSFDHQVLVPRLADAPIAKCPSSLAKSVAGHSPTQDNLDGIVGAAFERFVLDPRTMFAGNLFTSGDLFVQTELRDAPSLSVSRAAFRPGRNFVLKTHAELQADADRMQDSLNFMLVVNVSSDGTRAVLEVGAGVIGPVGSGVGSLCCCSDTDVYEKRDGRWNFVCRQDTMCP